MILYLFCNNVWLDVVSASKFDKKQSVFEQSNFS